MRSVIGLVLQLTVAFHAVAQAPKPAVKVGDKAPEFALANGDGKLVTLADYTAKGAALIVFYRGYW